MVKTLVVAQRVESGRLLLDNDSTWGSIGHGVVFYVCFIRDDGASANEPGPSTNPSPARVAETLCTARIMANNESVDDGNADVLIVPQASLAGKLKSKRPQYHRLAPKQEIEAHYHAFVEEIRRRLGESQKLVFGTYGNRQGLAIESDGPFTSYYEL